MLAGISVGAGVSLAGCGFGNGGGDDGDDGDGTEELGEPVETLVIEYLSDIGETATIENFMPLVQEDLEQLGIDVEIVPRETASQLGSVAANSREFNVVHYPAYSLPGRLDPTEHLFEYRIDGAGAEGFNTANWPSCEYTNNAVLQQQASSRDEQQNFLRQALEVMSQASIVVPIVTRDAIYAYRTDTVDPGRLGRSGLALENPDAFITSQPVGKDSIISGVVPRVVNPANFTQLANVTATYPWNHLIHSPLVGYDENWELRGVLAENYEVSDDGRTLTFELRDGNFHNGDPITPEDVQFTYNFLMDTADLTPDRAFTDIESIEAPDDSTVVFNLAQPDRVFLQNTLNRWAVLHRDSWIEAGAEENPQEVAFDAENQPGSGPFEVTSHDPSSELNLAPHDGHPTFEPGHDLTFTIYSDEQAKLQALEAEEIDVVPQVSYQGFNRLAEQDAANIAAESADGFTPFYFTHQYSHGPTKFRAFRRAFGAVIDRRRINEVAFRGEVDVLTTASYILERHPLFPDDDSGIYNYTDDPTGDVEGARQLLSDAGWGWDDDGTLHYPPDANREPRWPEDETPDPSNHDCLNEDGSYSPPE